MRVGILGSGLMGGKLGTLFARAGHDGVFSYARSMEKLKKLAREAHGNARAGTPSEAAQDADALLLAVHWSRIDDVLKQAGDVSGKVIVSCSLPMNADNTELVVAHTSSGAEVLANKIPRAEVIAAFSTVPSEVLFGVFEARSKPARPSLVLKALSWEMAGSSPSRHGNVGLFAWVQVRAGGMPASTLLVCASRTSRSASSGRSKRWAIRRSAAARTAAT